MTRPNFGLFWRLLSSYLLVILAGCLTLYWAGGAFAAYFFERYMGGMMQQMQHMSPMMQAMAMDLDDAYRAATERSMMWGLGISALVATFVGFFVTRRIVTPVRSMQRASQRIAAGQYKERLPTSAPGEIADLAASFNEMAAALDRIETRRVELLANVAHEFRTPLTNLRGYVSGIRDGIIRPDEEALDSCSRQLSRLERLVSDLALLSRVETGRELLQVRAVDASVLVRDAVASFRPRYEAKRVKLEVRIAGDPRPVRADPQRTAQVLGNLLENALKYTPSRGSVSISITQTNGEIRFEVRDTGEGIPSDDLPHVFTRFYRVDKARSFSPGGGSGIGLTIAKLYVEQQAGRIGAEAPVDGGTRFWFTLPAASRDDASNERR